MSKGLKQLLTERGFYLLIAGTFVLAFFSGGYFNVARNTAGLAAWSLVLILIAAAGMPLPKSRSAVATALGLLTLATWSAVSMLWTPIVDDAFHDVQRILLYLGVFIAACGLFHSTRQKRLLEPLLAISAFLIICYGLSERLLPTFFELTPTGSAAGRLEQPITYWNAMGLMAAYGFILATRVIGTPSRAVWVRSAFASLTPTLLLAAYLTFSRGAVAAVAIGLFVLLALSPTRRQLKATATAVTGGALAVGISALLPEVKEPVTDFVRSTTGVPSAATWDGLVMLSTLLLLGAICAGFTYRTTASKTEDTELKYLRKLSTVGILLTVLIGLLTTVTLLDKRDTVNRSGLLGSQPGRFVSVASNRPEYWKVAARMYADHPFKGAGASSFQTYWLAKRPFPEQAKDAHSFYIEMPAELGIPGVIGMLLLLTGGAALAQTAYRRSPEETVGLCALLACWVLHAGFDWDWEMPAVTLPILLALGALSRTTDDRQDPSDLT